MRYVTNPDLDRVRTPEREELMYSLYPTFIEASELVRRINALDGAPVELADLRIWALCIGVRRPHAGCSRALSRIRNPARDAVVRRLCPTMATDDDILDAVNELSGKMALTRNYLPSYFFAVGVSRSEEYRAWQRDSAAVTDLGPREILPPQEIDYETAIAWGKRCGVKVVDDPLQTMAAINRKRDEFRLPRFMACKPACDLEQVKKAWEYA